MLQVDMQISNHSHQWHHCAISIKHFSNSFARAQTVSLIAVNRRNSGFTTLKLINYYNNRIFTDAMQRVLLFCLWPVNVFHLFNFIHFFFFVISFSCCYGGGGGGGGRRGGRGGRGGGRGPTVSVLKTFLTFSVGQSLYIDHVDVYVGRLGHCRWFSID